MGRRPKNTVDYFPHDADAAEGDTLTILQSQYGNDGYAVWFKLLEKLAAAENHLIDCNGLRWKVLIAKLGVTEARGLEIMGTITECGAIDSELWDNKIIWCQNLVNNLASVYRNRRMELPTRPITTPIKAISTPINEVVECSKEKPDTLLKVLNQLSGWGEDKNDSLWLAEFTQEFPGLDIPHVRACRDYHSNKSKHTKAIWKTRLRNWLNIERRSNDRKATPGQKPRGAFDDISE